MVVPVFKNPGSLSPFFSSMLFRRHRSKSNPPLAGRSMEPVILLHRKGTVTHQGHGESYRHGKEWGEIQIQIACRVPRRAQQEGKGGGAAGVPGGWMDGRSSQLR
jgi:hypothetical protein